MVRAPFCDDVQTLKLPNGYQPTSAFPPGIEPNLADYFDEAGASPGRRFANLPSSRTP